MNLRVIAVCLPLALTGCGGKLGEIRDDYLSAIGLGRGGGSGGQVAQSAPVQTLLENATNLEMTNRYDRSSSGTVTCSGTICETYGRNGNFGLSAYHAQWLRSSSLSGSAAVGGDDNFTFRMIRRLGHHSGYYAIRFNYENTGIYDESFSAAFGGPERKPVSGTGTWTGSMGGHEVRNGIQLNGKSTVTYSFGNNTVNIRLYDIRGANYFGDSELSWRNMSVNNDGSFYYSGSDYVAGNFYGPNAEETTGIFEDGTLAGAWFASR